MKIPSAKATSILPAMVLAFVLAISLSVVAAAAEVATLRTPGPDAEATQEPTEEVDGQQAILDFAACMRDNGIDFPDPQFGVGGIGGFLGGGGADGIDFMSSEFLDGMEACESLLTSFRPELDPELEAERREKEVLFAQCMREKGFDFPDPDPARGFSIGSLRGNDGGLGFDPFSFDFLDASSTCIQTADITIPGAVR